MIMCGSLSAWSMILNNCESCAFPCIEDYPDHPLGWQILGAALHDSGQLEKALDIKQKTNVRFPKDANAFNNLAHTLLAMGRYRAALVSARKALRLDAALLAAKQHEAQALAGLAANTPADFP